MKPSVLSTTVILGAETPPDPSFGGKGENLAELVAARLPVPPCGVITTAAYLAMDESSPAIADISARIESGERVPADEVDAVFRDGVVLTDDLARDIIALADAVGEGAPLAVRSSATVEDLGGSSFAGQYRSVLNVDSTDPDAVLAAVRKVWASLWHPAPSAYRRVFDITGSGAAMAVILMRMVEPDSAGVAFTTDPAGDSAQVRIEAVEGYGESLVSGERTPTAWVAQRSPSERAPLPDEIAAVLELSLEVEDLFGAPQDVEWAVADGSVYLLQARPITALDDHDGFDTSQDDHELTTAGIVEMVPGVLPPLRWELNQFLLEAAFRSVLDDLGVLSAASTQDRLFVRRVRGRAAIDFDQLREVAATIPGAVEELELQYFGDRPTVPTDSGRSWWRSLRHDLRVLRTRRRVVEQAEIVTTAVAQLADRWPRIVGWSDRRLLAYRLRLVDLAARGLAGELGVAAAGAAAFRRLELLVEPHLGAPEAARMAQRVTAGRAAPAVCGPEASAAVFGGPTWEEMGRRPPVIEPVADGEAARIELEARLQALPHWRRRRVLTGQFVDVRIHMLRRTIAETVTQLERREAAKAAILEIGGEVRRLHLELGSRLVARRLLADGQDVEFLTSAELRSALLDGCAVPFDVLRRRRNWASRYEAEGPLPARFLGVPDRAPVPLPKGDRLSGWAASPGRYRGTAVVCDSPEAPVPRGAVLVATSTDASWSPLFIDVGAIIVERGGPLSHAAILARELGLPAVLNVPGATRVLDGRQVTVDGDAGVVVVDEDAP